MGKFKFNPVTGTFDNISEENVSVPENTETKNLDEMKSVEDVIEKKTSLTQNVDEPLVTFRERSDYTVMQILDKDTGNALAYIGGYALDFSFNLKKLNSTAKIEQCLEGIRKLFRQVIMDKVLNNDNS